MTALLFAQTGWMVHAHGEQEIPIVTSTTHQLQTEPIEAMASTQSIYYINPGQSTASYRVNDCR